MITLEEARSLLRKEITENNLLKHCIAVSAIMKGLAKKLNEDELLWQITGLLHDIDYEQTKNNHAQHGLIAAEMLKEKLPSDALQAIKAHNFENTSVLPKSKIDIALIAADSISGLIIATALIYPSKKLEEVKVKSITKRFKKKDFARNCNREKMLYCEKLNINFPEFAEIALNSLKKIHAELGL